MGEAAVGAHGILMIAAFLVLSQLAEVVAWWASNKVSARGPGVEGTTLSSDAPSSPSIHTCPQTNLRTNYFNVIENGSRLWNVHRGLNSLALVLGLVGMIIILSVEEFQEAMSPIQRHIIYGFVMIVAVFLQIFFRVAYPSVRLQEGLALYITSVSSCPTHPRTHPPTGQVQVGTPLGGPPHQHLGVLRGLYGL